MCLRTMHWKMHFSQTLFIFIKSIAVTAEQRHNNKCCRDYNRSNAKDENQTESHKSSPFDKSDYILSISHTP